MGADSPSIEAVVFDVGNVLLPLDYGPFLEFLAESGVDSGDVPGWLDRVGLESHERGELPGEAFLARLVAEATRPMDPARLRTAWLEMFAVAPEMLALAIGLKNRYRVYLLSNIGDLHWAHVDGRFGLEGLVHGAMASFRAGAVKPSAEIYRAAERSFALEPARTVFVDDLAANVRGAEACGWWAVHHRDPAATRAALRRLGVRLPAAFEKD